MADASIGPIPRYGVKFMEHARAAAELGVVGSYRFNYDRSIKPGDDPPLPIATRNGRAAASSRLVLNLENARLAIAASDRCTGLARQFRCR